MQQLVNNHTFTKCFDLWLEWPCKGFFMPRTLELLSIVSWPSNARESVACHYFELYGKVGNCTEL